MAHKKRHHHEEKRHEMKHHGKKDGYSMHESRGMKVEEHNREEFNDEWRHDKAAERADYRKGKMQGGEYYAGIDARRRQEMQDGNMLFEDHRSIANLPQDVMIKPYPKTGPYMPEGLDDTGMGVEKQMDMDDSIRRRHIFPKKV